MPFSFLDVLDEFASGAAAAVLNRMLSREPWARAALAPFAGRSARLQALPFSVQLGIVALLRAALLAAREASSRLASTTADYLTAENPMLVSRAEMTSFAEQVTRLRDDVERLAKQIELRPRPPD